MLKRLYIDNFRCLVNFEFKPEAGIQLIAGENGSGKSSVFDALWKLRAFFAGDSADHSYAAPALFTRDNLTTWAEQFRQTFELDVEGVGGLFRYRLVIEHHPHEIEKCKVSQEQLSFDNAPLFTFENGEVALYRDDPTTGPGPTFPANWTQSGASGVQDGKRDNTKLTWFRNWLRHSYCGKINPFGIDPISKREHSFLGQEMKNFASWYRYIYQQFPERAAHLVQSLQEVMPGLVSLPLYDVGEQSKVLTARFSNPKNSLKDNQYTFRQLSEGQRCLVCLYSLLCFVLESEHQSIFCIDEPDNFVSLREIQPWLSELNLLIEDKGRQVIIISHHPDIINYLAHDCGIFMWREQEGPTRFKPFKGAVEPPLTPSEAVARGWVDA